MATKTEEERKNGGGNSIISSKKILLTSLSAMVAETSTFPIDLIKTQLQLHGESRSRASLNYRTNAFKVSMEIIGKDGVLGLYKGLSPAIIRHLFYTPIRIVGYEYLRNRFVSSDHSLSLSTKAIVGGISGVVAQVLFLLFCFFFFFPLFCFSVHLSSFSCAALLVVPRVE